VFEQSTVCVLDETLLEGSEQKPARGIDVRER
jgi:hypothetical protein